MKPKRNQAMLPALSEVPVYPVRGAVMGLDPSLRGNALCVARPGQSFIEERYTSEPAKTVRDRSDRYRGLVVPVVRAVRLYGVGAVFVEGYAHSRKEGRGILDRAEFRGVLGLALTRFPGLIIVEVDPSTGKLFAADNGNADKDAVKAGLEARYGHAPFGPSKESEDTADAFGMAMLGMCAVGLSACESAAQRQAVTQVVKLLKEAA